MEGQGPAATSGQEVSMRRNRLSPAFAETLELRARSMRHAPTPSERLLWSRLRAKKLGVLFRRQVVLARFVVDFCAVARKLVVEVDGPYHTRAPFARKDARRDGALSRLGYRVLRLPAELVMRDVEAAVALVRQALA